MITSSRSAAQYTDQEPLSEQLAQAQRRIEQLEQAVEAHGCVGQAMGILMARYTIGEDPAFAALLRVSQQHNQKLRTLSDAVVRTVTEPGTRLPRELVEALESLLRDGEAQRA